MTRELWIERMGRWFECPERENQLKSQRPLTNGWFVNLSKYRNIIHVAVVMGTLMVCGCMGKSGALPAVVEPATAIGIMSAAPGNTILAVGGTVQLSVTAQSLTGTPLTTFDSVVYRLDNLADSLRLRVSAAGLVTGVASSGLSLAVDVLVFRSGTYNGDQVLITVTPTAIPGLTLSIQPPAADSAKLARGVAKTITPVLLNPVTGQSFTGLQLQYAVLPSDGANVGVFRGTILISANAGITNRSPGGAAKNQIIPLVATGGAWIYANVNAYGTLLQDSVRYTFTYPYTGSIRVTKQSLAVMTTLNGGTATAATANPDITMAPAGTMTFTNGIASGDPLTVVFTFDNPATATVAVPPSSVGGTTGNITTLAAGQSATRKFLTPGTYHWTWVASGGPAPWSGQSATGAIVVK